MRVYFGHIDNFYDYFFYFQGLERIQQSSSDDDADPERKRRKQSPSLAKNRRANH